MSKNQQFDYKVYGRLALIQSQFAMNLFKFQTLKPGLHGTFAVYDKSYVLKIPTTSRRGFENRLERARAVLEHTNRRTLQIVPCKSGLN